LAAAYAMNEKPPAHVPAQTQPAVPVQTATATQGDVPIYLEGLGTVQAFSTINVTTRVDGQLQTIHYVEGQDVKKGDVLVQIDPRTYRAALDQATAIKQKDEAQFANAQLDLQRYTTLAPQGYTSKQTLDTQRALVAQLEAQVETDQAVIDTAAANLDYTTITSPIEGRIGIKLVSAGNNLLASANTPIVVVTQMHPISVIFTLPEDDLPAIAKALAAGKLDVLALSRDNQSELDKGKLLAIDNQIQQATGTVRLKATFPNAKDNLWPGQFVNVRLMLEVKHDALTIPSPSVQRGPNGLFVYVLKPDSTVEVRPVSLELFQDGQAILQNGLRPGEKVVAAGQYRLQAGTRVQPSNYQVAHAISGTAPIPGTAP
jgi:multidrug efflux system membrane fusion protein